MAGPFKMKSGNSPLKESKDWFNVRGYLKGEQGLIPDYKGESTTKTATNVSKAIQEGHGKVKQVVKNMLSPEMTKDEKSKPKPKADAKMTKVAKPLERKKDKVLKIKPIGVQKIKVNIQTEPKSRPQQS